MRRKRRRRTLSLEAELRQSAKQIYESQMSEALRAAALLVVSRKLDEVRQILVASGLGTAANVQSAIPGIASQPVVQPSPPPVQNPCCQCGRPGIYKTKPHQFNRTGSWYCRAHMALGGMIEAEDKMDKVAIQSQPPPSQPPQSQPLPPVQQDLPSPGASSLAEAMGMAEIVEEPH